MQSNSVGVSRSTTSFARFILIELVVLNHCYQGDELLFSVTSPSLAYLSAFLFVISFKSFESKLKSIAKKLLVPYLGVNVIYYVIYYFAKNFLLKVNLGDSFKRLPPNLSVDSFLESITVNPVNGPFWFLRDLIIAQTVCVFIFIFKGNLRIFTVATTCALIIVLLPENRFYLPYCVGLTVTLLAETAIGKCLYKYLLSITAVKTIKAMAAVSCFFLSLYFNSIFNIAAFLSNIFGGFFTLLLVGFLSSGLEFKDEKVIETYSFYIFSSHSIVVGGIRVLLIISGVSFDLMDGVPIYFLVNCALFLLFYMYHLMIKQPQFRMVNQIIFRNDVILRLFNWK
jgi:hypothetical protein